MSARRRETASYLPKESIKGAEIKQSDLALGGPLVLAWPKDAKSGVVRDGSQSLLEPSEYGESVGASMPS
jgi:hypothetical protein